MRLRAAPGLGIGSLLLTLLASPAVAGNDVVARVDGDHFSQAGISLISQSCVDQSGLPNAFKPSIIDDDGGLGKRALSWDIEGSGMHTGPAAHTDTPNELTDLSTQLRWIAGGVTGGVVVHFHPKDGGVWKGYQALPPDTTWGWHEVAVDLSSINFTWRHFTGNVQDGSAPASTLRNLVNDRGGNADGAEVGFAFGCEGKDFVLDGLKLSTDAGSITYDYEGYATAAGLRLSGAATGRTTVIAGARVKLTATLKRRIGGDPVRTTVTLQRRPLSASRWTDVTRLELGSDGTATYSVQPVRASAYRIIYDGAGLVDGDVSASVSSKVRANVQAKIAKRKVITGKSFTIKGRFWPGRATKLKVQSYHNYKWTTFKVIRSKRNGTFKVSRKTSRIGKSYWRVLVPAGDGNLSGHSPSMKLVTKPKPKPDKGHHGGSGHHTPPPSNPTPPPPEPPQPDPPDGPF